MVISLQVQLICRKDQVKRSRKEDTERETNGSKITICGSVTNGRDNATTNRGVDSTKEGEAGRDMSSVSWGRTNSHLCF